jgi:hypothetical protein
MNPKLENKIAGGKRSAEDVVIDIRRAAAPLIF